MPEIVSPLSTLWRDFEPRRGILFLTNIGLPIVVGLVRGEANGALIGAITGLLLSIADTEGPLAGRLRLTLMVAAGIVAGALLGHYMTFIQPKMFSMVKSTELTIIVIFGGLGSISGSVLGAVVLTFLPELLRAVDKWRLVVYGLAVIGIMIGRPRGLMGGFELTPKSVRAHFARLREAKAARADQAAEEKGGL